MVRINEDRIDNGRRSNERYVYLRSYRCDAGGRDNLDGQSAYRRELCLDVIISRNRLGEPIGIRGSIAKITDTEA